MAHETNIRVFIFNIVSHFGLHIGFAIGNQECYNFDKWFRSVFHSHSKRCFLSNHLIVAEQPYELDKIVSEKPLVAFLKSLESRLDLVIEESREDGRELRQIVFDLSAQEYLLVDLALMGLGVLRNTPNYTLNVKREAPQMFELTMQEDRE